MDAAIDDWRFRCATSLAKNMRRLRATRGLSQEALAHECGMGRTYLSGVERSERTCRSTTSGASRGGCGSRRGSCSGTTEPSPASREDAGAAGGRSGFGDEETSSSPRNHAVTRGAELIEQSRGVKFGKFDRILT
jgi:hypothetical protein